MTVIMSISNDYISRKPGAFPLHPFKDMKGDIILRSSDYVEFPAFQFLLSLSSSFFNAMFELPQPADSRTYETKDGLPVIQMSENSQVIDLVLRYCYPTGTVDVPQMGNLKQVTNLLEAGTKYGMHGVEKVATGMLIGPHFLGSQPVAVFAIAYHYKLEKETRLAAKHTLRQSQPPDEEGLELITARTFVQLMKYSAKCKEAVLGIQENLDWLLEGLLSGYPTMPRLGKCTCEFTQLGSIICPRWLTEYICDTAAVLKERPRVETLKEKVPTTMQKAASCTVCRIESSYIVPKVTNLMEKELERIISEIVLDLPF